MKLLALGFLALAGSEAVAAPAPLPVLQRSDVVSMYQASPDVYREYGATVLAWGGTPNAKSLAEARGLKFFGSVGMVTEFSRYHERFPETYEQGLCRNLEGKPFKVPWLTDHQHKGVPYWWCCTRQPLFREYISGRVVETVKAGAFGVHIDDHLGTAGGLFAGGCFCDRCVAEFSGYLATLPREKLDQLQVANPASFNYGNELRAWLAEKPGRKAHDHPAYAQFRVFQLRGAAQFMAELRALAAKTAGRPVPMSANACLTWGPHLNDYQSLDFFSAEVEHHAPAKRLSDDPLVAYRLADAVGRPLAATASGGDWAFIKEQNLPGLVQGWIALGYAAGQSLMAPHRQWCYTPEKGTHWYEGPAQEFAPLYQFVRQNAELFDGFQAHADVTVVLAQRAFDRDARKVMDACSQLASANIAYRIALGGDDVVDHPLPAQEIRGSTRLLVFSGPDFSPADQATLGEVRTGQRLDNIAQALAEVKPAVRVKPTTPLRVLPRVKPGAAVIHVVNWQFDPATGTVAPVRDVQVEVNVEALGLAPNAQPTLYSPGAQPVKLRFDGRNLLLPEVGTWAVIALRDP